MGDHFENPRSKAAMLKQRLRSDRQKLEESLNPERDPFAMIPEVVMRDHLVKYFLCLEDAKDKVSISRSSRSASSALKPFQFSWLFNEVFPIPSFHLQFSSKELLHFRLVCKDWRSAIANYTNARPWIIDPDYASYKRILKSSAIIRFNDSKYDQQQRRKNWPMSILFQSLLQLSELCPHNIDSFIERAGKQPGSVFPSIKLRFGLLHYCPGSPPREEGFQIYRDKLSLLLDKFGNTVRHISLSFEGATAVSDQLNLIKDCLDRSPNISSLTYSYDGGPRDEKLKDLTIDNLPISPELSNLKCLVVENRSWDNIGSAFIFRRYFDQLVSLQVDSVLVQFMRSYNPAIHSSFPKLKYLAIRARCFHELKKLQFISGPLEELKIVSGWDLGQVPSCIYFHFAEKFKETLSTLEILPVLFGSDCDIPLVTWDRYGLREPIGIDLPKLKVLVMGINECGFGSMDSLLMLTHPPEYLELVVGCCSHRARHSFRTSQLIQLHDMRVCDLWARLPKLEEIAIWNFRSRREVASSLQAHYIRERHGKELTRGFGFSQNGLSFVEPPLSDLNSNMTSPGRGRRRLWMKMGMDKTTVIWILCLMGLTCSVVIILTWKLT